MANGERQTQRQSGDIFGLGNLFAMQRATTQDLRARTKDLLVGTESFSQAERLERLENTYADIANQALEAYRSVLGRDNVPSPIRKTEPLKEVDEFLTTIDKPAKPVTITKRIDVDEKIPAMEQSFFLPTQLVTKPTFATGNIMKDIAMAFDPENLFLDPGEKDRTINMRLKDVENRWGRARFIRAMRDFLGTKPEEKREEEFKLPAPGTSTIFSLNNLGGR